ncbi:butyrophilin subfamily 1 member A1-like isoform X2 [Alligator mississippiensis]|uniref:butyrophilin subfamily 1 member A1-like isoform X2 n=1 Tax=Alligator mississippiensis TaxID=8496 RepID=UPI0028773288|nr:butyrophilin subfamily 1 member A1-like isoform X2 [Alligator mississippiensis]
MASCSTSSCCRQSCAVFFSQFTVIGSAQPITAIVGQDIVLPCHLSPRMSAENMEVRWFRNYFDTFVHLYPDGRDQNGQQIPEYRGRTELLNSGIMNGNISLKIFNIERADEGQYHCFVQDETANAETALLLNIAVLGSVPLIAVEDYQEGGIRIICRSTGWFPEPKVVWRDPSGQHLPSLSDEAKAQKNNGLFETETAIVIQEHANSNLSCWIRDKYLSQGKESTIYISDPFFPRVNTWMVAVIVTLVVFLGLSVLTIYFFKLRSNLLRQLGWRRDITCPGLGRTAAPVEEVKVTLDPDTAHPQLVLSEDGRSVTRTETWQQLPDSAQRFDSEWCVLGRERLFSGRHWWEVEVLGGGHWAVGVARESVRRKGWICFGPEEGIWGVQRWGDVFQPLTGPDRRPLSLPVMPSWIRVYLDCAGRQVWFFYADTEAPIFTFPLPSLTGDSIRPFLSLEDTTVQVTFHTAPLTPPCTAPERGS